MLGEKGGGKQFRCGPSLNVRAANKEATSRIAGAHGELSWRAVVYSKEFAAVAAVVTSQRPWLVTMRSKYVNSSRLETRTKECSNEASIRVENPRCVMKVKGAWSAQKWDDCSQSAPLSDQDVMHRLILDRAPF